MTRTRQEIFDIVYLGLKSQGFRRSSCDDGGCYYRGPNGLKCAVGHLIADENYGAYLEGQTAVDFDVLKAANVSSDDDIFLFDLQERHDEARTPALMRAALAAFAAHYGLPIPEDAA